MFNRIESRSLSDMGFIFTPFLEELTMPPEFKADIGIFMRCDGGFHSTMLFNYVKQPEEFEVYGVLGLQAIMGEVAAYALVTHAKHIEGYDSFGIPIRCIADPVINVVAILGFYPSCIVYSNGRIPDATFGE